MIACEVTFAQQRARNKLLFLRKDKTAIVQW